MKQVGICLPSYNESENIVQLINKILETEITLLYVWWMIIVQIIHTI